MTLPAPRVVAVEAVEQPPKLARRNGLPWLRWLAWLTALAVAGVLAWLWYARHAAVDATGFRAVAASRGDLRVTVSATGTIEPEEVVDIGAQVVGMIRGFGRDLHDPQKFVDYGSAVEEGTVLAQIDDTVYRAQRDQARANLQRARADLIQLHAKLHKSELDLNRNQELLRRDLIALGDYDTTVADHETARSALAVGEATVVQAEAQLEQAEINLGYTTIKSPVKGVIVDRRVNIGQTVVSSLNAPSLFLIAKDLTRVQVWASVNEADIGRIRRGQVVRFTVDAFPGETFVGEVTQVRLNATMTQNVVTYTVVVTVDNRDGRLLPYLTTTLRFEIDQRNGVILVPNAALRWQPQPEQVAPEWRDAFRGGLASSGAPSDSSWVWVAEENFVHPVATRIGLSDGLSTEIVSGELHEGDQVVVGETSAADSEGEASPFAPRLFGGGRR